VAGRPGWPHLRRFRSPLSTERRALRFTEFGPVSNLGLIELPGLQAGAQLGSPLEQNSRQKMTSNVQEE